MDRAGGKPSNRGIVLVVDDSADALEMVRRYLERHGYAVLTTSAPTEVASMIQRHQPDLIVLDVMMPMFSGTSVAHLLRRNASSYSLPLIFYTSLTETEVMPLTRHLLRTHYVAKPDGVRALLKAIEQVLQGPRSLRPPPLGEAQDTREPPRDNDR